jgi:hypothetical protein
LGGNAPTKQVVSNFETGRAEFFRPRLRDPSNRGVKEAVSSLAVRGPFQKMKQILESPSPRSVRFLKQNASVSRQFKENSLLTGTSVRSGHGPRRRHANLDRSTGDATSKAIPEENRLGMHPVAVFQRIHS